MGPAEDVNLIELTRRVVNDPRPAPVLLVRRRVPARYLGLTRRQLPVAIVNDQGSVLNVRRCVLVTIKNKQIWSMNPVKGPDMAFTKQVGLESLSQCAA